MKTTCIVGAGIANLLLILLLQESGADLSKLTIIDPFFDGGDLIRKWTTVLSNTPWSKTIDALKNACPSLTITSSTDPAACTPLIEIAHLIRTLAEAPLKKTLQVQGTVASADYNTEAKEWTVQAMVNGSLQTIRAQQLILAPGGEPKP